MKRKGNNRTIRRHRRDAKYYYLGVTQAWKNLKRMKLRQRIRLAFSLVFRGNAGEKECRRLSK